MLYREYPITEVSKNYNGDGWLDENDTIEYEEDDDGFVSDTGSEKNRSESVGGLGAIDRPRIDYDDYDFSKHPKVISYKIARILQEKFDRFIDSQEIQMGKDITFNTFPELIGKMGEKRLLFESAMNGILYAYVQVFGQVICLGAVVKNKRRGGTSHAKMGQLGTKVIYEYTINSPIIGRITGTGSDDTQAVKDLVTQIYDMFSKISPNDFPQEEEEIDYDNAVVTGSVEGCNYTIRTLKDSDDDICLEFEYDGCMYSTTDMKFDVLGKRKIYFLYPNGSDRKTENAFRKRIGAEGRTFEIRVQRLVKNIVKILKGQKKQDSEIISYLNSLKKTK